MRSGTKKKANPKIKFLWIAAIACMLVFAGLLAYRTGPHRLRSEVTVKTDTQMIAERDNWMNITQNGRKIGYSHSRFSKINGGYAIKEFLYLRINTMGLLQDIHLETEGRLGSDLSLVGFDFEINSSRFRFVARGSVAENVLLVDVKGVEGTQSYRIPLRRKPYLAAGLVDMIAHMKHDTKAPITIHIFDPATLTQVPVSVRPLGEEDILYRGRMIKTRKVAIDFKGTQQLAWIDAQVGVIKEKGLFGITLERTTQNDALYGSPIQSGQDLTRVASVPSNQILKNPEQLEQLKVEINNIDYAKVQLNGGRQSFQAPVLSVSKEKPADIPALLHRRGEKTDADEIDRFLKPSPFIQSNHRTIQKLADQITSKTDSALESIKGLMAWIEANIERRPVFSVPDALATLENRMGDCNEHAVLMAALSRAAGIPAKVEAGLVYMHGRFYYHAWNAVYLGKWVTVDVLFGQIPADVTHIRLSSGDQKEQLDLMNVIGKIKLRIISYR